MKNLISAITFIFCFCITFTNVDAKKPFTWKSSRDYKCIPLHDVCILGFNASSVEDTLIENWFYAEIREKFNTVRIISTIEPDLSFVSEFERQLEPIRDLDVDAIITYAILPELKKGGAKKRKDYSPLLQQATMNSLWSYFAQNDKILKKDTDTTQAYYVEINIYEQNTLQLIWSGRSYPVGYSDRAAIQKWMEKILFKAVKENVINEEKD